MMARRDVMRAPLALAGAVMLSSCGGDVADMPFLWQPPYYAKLKVEVETPEGIKSGFSVIEVKWDKAGRGFNVRGEAVAVDLPKSETLFVLLRSQPSVDWAAYLHQLVKLENSPEDQTLYYGQIAADPRVWTVPRTLESPWGNKEMIDNYPYFVRFKDMADPKSVEQVDPDNLAKSFGAGYRLKSLTVQMTGEPVTVEIEKRLGWLMSVKGKNLDGSSLYDINAPLNAQLNSGDFRRGIKK
jgi:hypothetical protein